MSGAERFTLADLENIVAERAASDDPKSYTASLKRKGQPVAAKKLGEEAVETVIAAIEGDPARLTSEAADLLYHLLVVLEIGRVPLADVMAELRRRTAQTGLEEKAARNPG
ncbi:phosphoribosyl-ATP diphosphatase [Antarcticirhabdus aurantiaca]|uniref:Phosphoribosyl-ATP diphosphatase n=1 Tax=Antarcticirhabdus aurantiaca TaxID=2606717 RepID=A0ACD4NP44_9HYPH|nr:phosphoribosyl-ATP diphosphatase [Antarcticirhabdus aurantiaca]WAJ28586.1 phosphoribosyl-ATP diphosphatase [Jeongeuplla avenae]